MYFFCRFLNCLYVFVLLLNFFNVVWYRFVLYLFNVLCDCGFLLFSLYYVDYRFCFFIVVILLRNGFSLFFCIKFFYVNWLWGLWGWRSFFCFMGNVGGCWGLKSLRIVVMLLDMVVGNLIFMIGDSFFLKYFLVIMIGRGLILMFWWLFYVILRECLVWGLYGNGE